MIRKGASMTKLFAMVTDVALKILNKVETITGVTDGDVWLKPFPPS